MTASLRTSKGRTQGSFWRSAAGMALLVAGALILVTTVVTGGVAGAAHGDTERVSVASDGAEANDGNTRPNESAISADGRYVAFVSDATNLVDGDTNGFSDVFVHDRETGETTRVSVATNGDEGNDDSDAPEISADGRYVAFYSSATNLVPDDTNNWLDVFVHDRQTGETTLVSVNNSGEQGIFDSLRPAMSADGRYIAFTSVAPNLVDGDVNNLTDIFVHDRETGETTRVSVSSGGVETNHISGFPAISADGRYVAFESFASNLVDGDTNGVPDVFVHDRVTGETTRASVDSNGAEGGAMSNLPSISPNGRYVSFLSQATNLVEGDTNGVSDVFVHDRDAGETMRVSVDSAGNQASEASNLQTAMSHDGRYVAFYSSAPDLVDGDTNGLHDVFVHDRDTGVTSRVSESSNGAQSNGTSLLPDFSTDGRYVVFDSAGSNLVDGDTNSSRDVFVHQFLPDPPPPTTTTTTTTSTTTTTQPAPPSPSPPPPPPPPPTPGMDWFSDDDGHLFEGDINAIADVGVTKGCNPPTNDMFCPDRDVRRGETATFLARVMGLPTTSTDWFIDDDGGTHEDNINRIAEAGVTVGCNPPVNDEFCPDRSLTRAEMASLISRALNLAPSATDWFTDDDGNVHEVNINRIAEAGITLGCNPPTNDLFCLDDPVTRGQIAAFINRGFLDNP